MAGSAQLSIVFAKPGNEAYLSANKLTKSACDLHLLTACYHFSYLISQRVHELWENVIVDDRFRQVIVCVSEAPQSERRRLLDACI